MAMKQRYTLPRRKSDFITPKGQTRHCQPRSPVFLAMMLLMSLVGCKDSAPDKRPNILWVVLDTTRADRLSLYGYDKPTTPFLERWAGDARVYRNCLSVANTTSPAHASMFTGLMPSEHGVVNTGTTLAEGYQTIAEHLRDNGYQTYLFSANPHVSGLHNLSQGFEIEEHPWDRKYKQKAIRILQSKIAKLDPDSELPMRLRKKNISDWAIKASGQLAQEGVCDFLQNADSQRPFFIFLNYMEAHRPRVPPENLRRIFLNPEKLQQSYSMDLSWDKLWQYCFGLADYSPAELEVIGSVYDASVLELDDLLKNLLAAMDEAGYLDHTVVIVTSDHGEQLGEHHLLDHQYSLYEPLIRVPLIVKYPTLFEPGTDMKPVMNIDLFPTILQIAGLDSPLTHTGQAITLLSSAASQATSQPTSRSRVSEYRSPATAPFQTIQRMYSDWRPAYFRRKLRAVTMGNHKYIWSSDGRHALYDLQTDSGELRNLCLKQPKLAAELRSRLDTIVKGFSAPISVLLPAEEMSEAEKNQLRSLGYIGESQDPPKP